MYANLTPTDEHQNSHKEINGCYYVKVLPLNNISCEIKARLKTTLFQ